MDNQKKKVLLIITKSNFGGAQKYVFELAKSLKLNGYEVRVALGGDGILIDKLKEENIDTINLLFLNRDISVTQDFRTFVHLIKIIKNFRPDIVHLNSSKIGAIGTFASRLCFVPKTIFTIHGWAFNEDRSLISKTIIKIIYLITIFFSNTSIAVSQKTKDQADSIPFSFLIKNKIDVVRNGISIPDLLSKEDATAFLSNKTGVDLSNKKIIGQISELHPIKSIETTIHAAKEIVKKHNDVIIVVIGEGEERKFLEEKIKEHELENNFILAGFIDNAAKYIPAFDIFCLTSKSEALALVLIEAGLARVPVIASNVGGIPELITNSETGLLFEQKNTDELILKIEQLLSKENNDIFVENFYTKIKEGFLIEHMTNKTIKIYEA